MPNIKAKILVCDDTEANLCHLEAMLLSLGCQVVIARDGEESLLKVKETSPDIILIDTRMPKIDGFDAIMRLKSSETTRALPVIAMTSISETEDRVKALDMGADDLLTRPVDSIELRARLSSLLRIKTFYERLRSDQNMIETEVAKRTESLKQSFEKIKSASLDTIFRLSRAAEYKDEDTGAHIERMSHYSTSVARKMGMKEEFLEYILYASPMHDIGKIGIPDSVLHKPGKLEGEDWEIMKSHTSIGAKILENSTAEFMKMAEVIAITHHEKWNGAGYPRGIKGQDIPLEGRIVAMADVFDALTSERPYKKAFPIEKAFSIIQEGRGTHFDPDVADAFFSIKDEIEASLNWWNFLGSDSGKPGEEPLF